MPTTCTINFENNPMKVIYSNQMLRGTIHLNLTRTKNVRGVYICISGKASAKWEEYSKSSSDDSHEWDTFKGKEDYLNERTYFIGESQLLRGEYKYSFQCMLPANLPTSFEGKYGHIRYAAQVVLDMPKWKNKTFSVPFTVIKAVDLNADPMLRNPVMVEKVKKFGIFSSRSMKINAYTPVGGYTPGQTINLHIKVNNETNESILKFSAKLVKQVTYFTNDGHQKCETIPISKQEAIGCGKVETKTIRVNIPVPPVPPTDHSSSNIIKVIYVIRIKGTMGFLHSNIELDLPIIIGSYPIRDIMPSQPSSFLAPNAVANSPTNNAVSLYPSLGDDPPTYEEAISTNVHGTDANISDFRPKYPVFKRTTSYSSEI